MGDPANLASLTLAGGEPFLHPEAGAVLEYLIDTGTAPGIALCISTNGTIRRCSWLDLTGHFKSLHFQVSIDGLDRLNHYLRYPAGWDSILRNVAYLRGLPSKPSLRVAIAVQAYNALSLVELLDYLDSENLDFFLNILHRPKHLSVAALPPPVREIAATRLDRYTDWRGRPENRLKVRRLAQWLRRCGRQHDPVRLREFMIFTNDLDACREDALSDVCPELVHEIERAGFPWLKETRHASFPPSHA